MVPLSSYGIPRVPHYSGFSLPLRRFTYKTITFSGLSSHTVQLQLRVDYAVQNPGNITTPGLASFAFARRYWQNLGWFLFLALLRCFSSGGSLRITMYSLYGQYPCRYWGFPIRKSTDHNLFAVPRGLSQPITSFFGSQWQGIHPVLFLAWPFVYFRFLSGNTAKSMRKINESKYNYSLDLFTWIIWVSSVICSYWILHSVTCCYFIT